MLRRVRVPSSSFLSSRCNFLDNIPHPPCFSSSAKAKPSVFDGRDGVVQYISRTADRASRYLEHYHEHNVFPPSNWTPQNIILFMKLQLPTNTEVDAVDFLNGAQFACDMIVTTMYSKEFVDFATGVVSESSAAEKMRSILSDNCYTGVLFAVKKSIKTEGRMMLNQLNINRLHLCGVKWERLSLAQVKFEGALEAYNRARVVALGNHVEPKIENLTEDISNEDHVTMVERLQLDVLLLSVEHLITERGDKKMVQDSSTLWRFESLVTQPEHMDWRVVKLFSFRC